MLERSGKEKSQSERVLKENENARTTHTNKQRSKTYLSLRVLFVKQPEVVFVFFFCWTKERKFPTRNLKAAAAREEGEDISLKDDHQYQRRRRDGELRLSSGERIHVAVRSHETIHERRRRRWVGIVAVLL